jgi:hypothetical protein
MRAVLYLGVVAIDPSYPTGAVSGAGRRLGVQTPEESNGTEKFWCSVGPAHCSLLAAPHAE